MVYAKYWNDSAPMSFGPEKWTYAQKREFRYNLQSYMEHTFQFDRFRSGKSVLEIGSGAGIDSVELANSGAYVTAVDFTDNGVALTNALARETGQMFLDVRKADATKLPFVNEHFDAVYSFGVIHHIPEVKKALVEIRRVLKPHGLFFGMVYNKDSMLYQYSIVHLHENEGLTEEELVSKYSERNIGCPYTHAYTKDELQKLLSKYFQCVTVKTRYNVVDLPNQRKVKLDLPEGHPLGWHLCFEAIKP